MIMKRAAAELAEFLGGRLEGDGDRVVEALASLETASEGDLSYAESRYLEQVRLSRASCVLVPEGEFPGQTTIVVENPKAAFARAAEWLFPKSGPTAGIHPTAQIGKGVQLGAGVMVGPRCVIEDDVEIGPSTAVHAGCYIAEGVRIGAECTIRPNVVFYQGVEVHDRVVIHAGVILGSDGFGFVRDGAGYVKFPQIGRLVIEDDVEIGANSCIDRGALVPLSLSAGQNWTTSAMSPTMCASEPIRSLPRRRGFPGAATSVRMLSLPDRSVSPTMCVSTTVLSLAPSVASRVESAFGQEKFSGGHRPGR